MNLINDHFQNFKRHNLPKAQLIIADIPYNVGTDAYGSNPQWYIDGDNSKGTSLVAGKQFFDTDKDFRVSEFMHFTSKMLRPEPKERGEAGCMVVFCAFEQQMEVIIEGRTHGYANYLNLVFRKNFSPQVLKANMRIVGNCEYAIVLYRDKLPKFRNGGRMVMNCMEWERDSTTPKIHPTQKPIGVIRRLVEIFTDPGDVVIDPVAGSGISLLAAESLGRRAYGFEIKKEFCRAFTEQLAPTLRPEMRTLHQQTLDFGALA
jgi:site-specific DNA-methyltransferase (adenine-specific)